MEIRRAELSHSEAIRAAAEVASGRDQLALPAGFAIHDLEKFGNFRRRARGMMGSTVAADFAAYAKAHADPGACVFVDQDAMKAIAVLNLGTSDMPGHADNVAVLNMRKTAAYADLLRIADGNAKTQTQVAEWMEDWAPLLSASATDTEGETQPIRIPHAIAAVRKITIDAARKTESEVASLSASKSTLERITAHSGGLTLPTMIVLTTEPYDGLDSMDIALRMGVVTTGDKVSLVLRIQKAEAMQQEMAQALADLVRQEIGDAMPVLIGAYTAKP
jgi:uncharacterized protein YfdQ (DUF2303 family)